MSEKLPIKRSRMSALAAGLLLCLSTVACSSDEVASGLPSYNGHLSDESGSSDKPDPMTFMIDQMSKGLVLACVGQSSLKADGNMRLAPTTRGQKVEAFSDNTYNQQHNVTVNSPLRLELDTSDEASTGDVNEPVSSSWYAVNLPNGTLSFVNEIALVKDKFTCSAKAEAVGQMGYVIVDPPING